MRSVETAISRAFCGLAAAALLATIMFVAVAPAHDFNYPPLGCGAPGAWYFNDQPDVVGHVTPFSSTQAGSEIVNCRDIVNYRLRLAGLAASATIGLLVGASLINRRTRDGSRQFRYVADEAHRCGARGFGRSDR